MQAEVFLRQMWRISIEAEHESVPKQRTFIQNTAWLRLLASNTFLSLHLKVFITVQNTTMGWAIFYLFVTL